MTIHFTNDIMQVPRLGEWVQHISRTYHLDESTTFNMNLALEEALVNVMQYAYPDQQDMPIDLTCRKENDRLIFVLDDSGVAFDPTKDNSENMMPWLADDGSPLSPEKRQLGGLGILLLHEYAHDVHYRRLNEHNQLTITFVI